MRAFLVYSYILVISLLTSILITVSGTGRENGAADAHIWMEYA